MIKQLRLSFTHRFGSCRKIHFRLKASSALQISVAKIKTQLQGTHSRENQTQHAMM